MNAYVEALTAAIGKRTVTDVAQDWGVPRWVLYDALRGKARCPRREHLPAIAKGLGISIGELIELTYHDGPASNHDGDAAPAEAEAPANPPSPAGTPMTTPSG